MKKLIVLSLAMAAIFLTWGSVAPARAQDPAKDDKPTFYRLTPGVYVNGWPRLSFHYPKEWIERPPMIQEVFRASVPGPVPAPAFVYAPFAPPATPPAPPLDKMADFYATIFKNVATDVTVVADKPSRLRDGSPAREVELRMLMNGAPLNVMGLVAKKGDVTINMGVESVTAKTEEDLKAILYSIEFQPDKDKPVKVPPDIQELLDKHCSDLVARDVAKVMAHYSDRYLNSGMTKGEVERFWKQFIGSVTSYKIGITEFVAAGDQTYLVGFVTSNLGIGPLRENSIIKEDGEWKWFGNQRNPTP